MKSSHLKNLSLALCMALAVPSSYANKELALPDFGSSASAGVSERDEYYYSLAFLRSMRNSGVLLEDPELVEYLRTLATRLAEASDKPEAPVGFFMLNEDAFNAFAVPGGVIGINSGLMLHASRESELAAVLAHEIAHVTQKHTVRAMERTQKASLPVMLGTIALVAAASQADNGSSRNPYSRSNSASAGQAALISGMALMQQLQINYTRDNEYEADRIGIRSLQRAGFDVSAMASMFARMQTVFRSSSGNRVPQYLQTHPINVTRIAEAKARAQELGAQPVSERDDKFRQMRERVRVLQAKDYPKLVQFYESNIAARGASPDLQYGYAMALAYAGRYAQAQAALAKVQYSSGTSSASRDLLQLGVKLLELEIDQLAKNKQRWKPGYESLLASYPKHRVIGMRFASALIAEGQPEPAERAIDVLRELTTAYESDPAVHELLARAYELAGQPVRAGETYARASAYRGALEDSLAQLQNLTRRSDLSFYERSRVDALIAEIMPIVLEIRERENRSGPTQNSRVRAAFAAD
jgi:beta-barrel assembly-enhancing protease